MRLARHVAALSAVALVAVACGDGGNGDTGDSAEGRDSAEGTGDAEGGDALTLTFGHNAPGDSPTGEAAERFAELVAEKTGGEVEVDVFPDNQLGDNPDLVEQTGFGGIDLSLAGLGVLGPFVDGYNLMQVPFLFESQQHINEVVAGEIGEELAAELQQSQGIVLLDQSWDRMPRQLSGDAPIAVPSDLNGLVLRTGTDAAAQTFDLLGASPTSVPLDETYTSLEQGMIDGVELPTDYMFNLSIYEVNSTMTMNNHTYGTQFLAINEGTLESLSDEQQDALYEASAEAGEFNDEETAALQDAYRERLEDAGMEIYEPSDDERAQFIDMVEANLDQLEQIWPDAEGLGQRILDAR